MLYELTPFRRPAPADAWSSAVIARLVDRRLIARNQQGGISLSPALRAVLGDQLPAEARRSEFICAPRTSGRTRRIYRGGVSLFAGR